MKRGQAYTTYVVLGRDWVTQVLVASHKDRLEIKPFVFPIMGAFPYKGYFEEEDAMRTFANVRLTDRRPFAEGVGEIWTIQDASPHCVLFAPFEIWRHEGV